MSNAFYGTVRWSPSDVRSLRPQWSIKQAERFLLANERHIQDRLVEIGWNVLNELICYEEAEKENNSKKS